MLTYALVCSRMLTYAHVCRQVGHPTVWPAATFETFEAYGGIDGHGYFNNCIATNAWDVNNTIKKTGAKVCQQLVKHASS